MKKHYCAQTSEKEMQELWSDTGINKFDPNSTKPLYSIDTPPPTVSGSLHIGHIFSYTQAEIIARFRRMTGFNVFYPFGFDDNGLPTERLVEKVLGIKAHEMPRSEFITSCMETTKSYEDEFKALWSSLGFSCDWEMQYETISPEAQKISQTSFIELYEKGKAYTKDSPVLWCTECGTSIAQAELETTEKETHFYTLKFMLNQTGGSKETIQKGSDSQAPNSAIKSIYNFGNNINSNNNSMHDLAHLEVATTRPELLYGCVCLFIHPDDPRAGALKGKSVKVPIFNYEIPILTDDTVDPQKGTGIVMCATFGDATDVEWVEKHNLPYRHSITPDGHIEPSTPHIGGMTIRKGRQQIVNLLEQNQLITKDETINHMIGIHERCGTPTEILPSKQWYIDILTDKEKYLEAGEKINWFPTYMKHRYVNWVENLKWDWCISRQRYFGVPIPIWYCTKCGAPKAADIIQLPVNPLETVPLSPCICGNHAFTPETAVLDTWATSSMSPQINAHWKSEGDISDKLLPMSMHTQAHEIIRTWAFYSIVKSLYHTGEIPWKDLMICGFVLAKKGEKISKSKSNAAQSPSQLIEAHSADALRYWVAGAKLGTDTFFDAEELTISKRLINKLWNASKFCFMQLDGFKPELEELIMSGGNSFATQELNRQSDTLLPLDCWILNALQRTTLEATTALNQYELGLARHAIDHFFWDDFCDNYLELAKERLYQPEKHGLKAQRSGRIALYQVLLGILKLYAPYMPHITEYLYQYFYKDFEKNISLHQLQWNQTKPIDTLYLTFGEQVKTAITDARRYKSANNLSMKTEIPSLTITATPETKPLIEASIGDIKACTHANHCKINIG
ncbi:valine--tRNA ligase [Fusibacter bizertensis]